MVDKDFSHGRPPILILNHVFTYASKLLPTFDHLDGRIYHYTLIKVVDISLSFLEPSRNLNLDICSSIYGQISAWRSNLGKMLF